MIQQDQPTNRLNVTQQEREIVIDILHRFAPKDAIFWVFGSRATGNPKPFSDLDIAIERSHHQTISQATWMHLNEAFEQSLLPWKVDIVDYNNITPNFQKIIASHRRML